MARILIIESGKRRLVNVRLAPKSGIRQRTEHVCFVLSDLDGWKSAGVFGTLVLPNGAEEDQRRSFNTIQYGVVSEC
jgi:hypothetical protein